MVVTYLWILLLFVAHSCVEIRATKRIKKIIIHHNGNPLKRLGGGQVPNPGHWDPDMLEGEDEDGCGSQCPSEFKPRCTYHARAGIFITSGPCQFEKELCQRGVQDTTGVIYKPINIAKLQRGTQ